eukprot:Skav208743  [mRNA]  locus=scaffold742:368514:373442:- [translate_table: standard]
MTSDQFIHRIASPQALREKNVPGDAVIVLQGGDELSVYDTETPREDFGGVESNFQYLFGVKEPGCFAALRLDSKLDGTELAAPEPPTDSRRHATALKFQWMEKIYETWCGPVKPPAWFANAYSVEAAHVDELSEVLEKLGTKVRSATGGSFQVENDGDLLLVIVAY